MVPSVPTTALVYLKPMGQRTVRKCCIHVNSYYLNVQQFICLIWLEIQT